MITVDVRHRGYTLWTVVAGQVDAGAGAVLVRVREQVTGCVRALMLDLYGVILMDRSIPARGLPVATGPHRRETRTARGC
ncbi:hypothetical protein ACIPY6_34910 [Streptomyces sp. NPDC090054]|uniref:hypothetical protein n=1 Tax=unclassified Streptomyces TaxID=2593676 RepID=UPI0029BC6349|nr:hypothetical protein [Streptomyces sp. DK15]MDX2389298.1 hypothetical protein [Streptomyces sp. DK15]